MAITLVITMSYRNRTKLFLSERRGPPAASGSVRRAASCSEECKLEAKSSARRFPPPWRTISRGIAGVCRPDQECSASGRARSLPLWWNWVSTTCPWSMSWLTHAFGIGQARHRSAHITPACQCTRPRPRSCERAPVPRKRPGRSNIAPIARPRVLPAGDSRRSLPARR